LTTFEGAKTHPHFSPDGSLIAFSGQYDGDTDVYVVSVEGGRPERLTWHPGPDHVQGWAPDGEAVLFASGRINAPRSQPWLWTLSTSGGMPEPLPLPRAFTGSFSTDGAALAYQRVQPWETEFRNYRGGQAQPIRIIDLDNGGSLYVLGSDADEPRRLDITLRGDFPWARPHWEDVTSLIRQARISSTACI